MFGARQTKRLKAGKRDFSPCRDYFPGRARAHAEVALEGGGQAFSLHDGSTIKAFRRAVGIELTADLHGQLGGLRPDLPGAGAGSRCCTTTAPWGGSATSSGTPSRGCRRCLSGRCKGHRHACPNRLIADNPVTPVEPVIAEGRASSICAADVEGFLPVAKPASRA